MFVRLKNSTIENISNSKQMTFHSSLLFDLRNEIIRKIRNHGIVEYENFKQLIYDLDNDVLEKEIEAFWNGISFSEWFLDKMSVLSKNLYYMNLEKYKSFVWEECPKCKCMSVQKKIKK